jgi:predicted NBD/HSP70 family sugar kinase
VDTSEGVIKMPARMPGWTEFTARDWLTQHTDIPAVVENDANMMAYAERVVRQDGDAPTVTVKAGTSIGAGIIVNGTIYRGATFAAGEITHYRVAAAGEAPCSCGNRGCLETIASGAALVAALRSQGVDVSSTRDVVRLAHESNPAVTTAVRAAGANLGQVLCAVVNFFNPRSIYLGGLLPTVEPFVAAVRAQIYQGSHPLLTEALTVERTRADADAILIGCGQRAIEESLGTTITTQ